MSSTILDASALLALIQQERGGDKVEKALLRHECVVCTVNVTEVVSKLIDNGMSLVDATTAMRLPNLRTEPFSATLAQLAAALRPATRTLGLSLGDRACLALAQAMQPADVLTADASWLKVRIPHVTVRVIR